MIQEPQNKPEAEREGGSLLQLAAIVEESHDAIIGEALDGTITTWNGGAARMLGYTTQEAIGKSAELLLPVEMKDEVLSLLNRIKEGETVADYDSVRVRKDGSRIAIALSISPIKSADGTITGASIVERDITTRKKAEESMRQIQLIVENSHDAIIGVTLEGVVTAWNGGAESMFTYAKEEMIGRSMTDLFPLDRKDELSQLLEKVKRGEFIADYDSVWLKKDSTPADVEFSISPIRADVHFSVSPVKREDGAIIGASLVGRDITERKRDERHIEELNEVRSKFISIISHQLRTPLTAVNWNLEAVLNGDFGKLEDITHRFLQLTLKSSKELTDRINDLLTAMDIEEGRVVFEREEVAIDSIAAEIMNEAAKKCAIKNISCAYSALAGDVPALVGDNEKIRTAITKLVENAVVYTKEGGAITAKLAMKNGVIRFEVKDNGIGVPAPEQHRLFSRFFRASNASVMQQDAFGLGLFIAKSFVEQHGGNVGFESKEGEGSLFWFEIPAKTGR